MIPVSMTCRLSSFSFRASSRNMEYDYVTLLGSVFRPVAAAPEITETRIKSNGLKLKLNCSAAVFLVL